ncbi:MAG: hypothetical protein ACRCUY_00250, partial [Thermoguttaceae bacterium]
QQVPQQTDPKVGLQNGQVVVTRFSVGGIDEKRTVSNKLDDVIRAVIDLGGTYPDVVQMLTQANREKALTCRFEIDCLPEANRPYKRQWTDDDIVEEEPEAPAKKKNAWDPRTWFESSKDSKPFEKNSSHDTQSFSGRE